MNRAERRRQGKVNAKATKTWNINASQLQGIKEDATTKAIDTAFLLMLAIPTMVIHDHYAKIMKREVDGKCREERFAELCLDLYDTFQQGYVSLEELKACLEEETGMKLER